jgi:hypothetical protein
VVALTSYLRFDFLCKWFSALFPASIGLNDMIARSAPLASLRWGSILFVFFSVTFKYAALQEGIEVFRFFSVEALTESNAFIGAFWFRFIV